MKTINLFEYQNKVEIHDSFEKDLEEYLDVIWANREKTSYFQQDLEEDQIENQQFLQFLHQTNQIKSNNYVGVIHYQNHRINLLPKIFFDPTKTYDEDAIFQIHNHILWWLGYCRRIKFSNYQSTLGNSKGDFFEVLIYQFSKYTLKLFQNSLYQSYEEMNSELSFMKGRLNTSEYINSNLCKGLWHKLNCTFDSFVFDNEFNRIIKFVTKMLFNVTTLQENRKKLREILFILDEVTDEKASALQCARLKFNPLFQDFEIVRDYCQMFLTNSIQFPYKNDFKLFAFLLPMEYVFEDFVFGFMDKELPTITVKDQKKGIYLDEDKRFGLRPDLLIQRYGKSLIADTKYKVVFSNDDDKKCGVSQTDLYQMLAYAVRFNVKDIILFYPSTIKKVKSEPVIDLRIKDMLADNVEIKIIGVQLSIFNETLVGQRLDPNASIGDLFELATEKLKQEISDAIKILI
jgi:5-methylcytosine-specific restriction enzyme subunit McrC